jgi:hypothetical protein
MAQICGKYKFMIIIRVRGEFLYKEVKPSGA